jgi:hypothetical protein
MTNLPLREQQIRQAHASLIHQVVQACHNRDTRAELDKVLEVAQQQGWQELVRVIRLIVDGQREASLLAGLDEEDTVIVSAILEGLHNPATLPEPNQQADPAMAAPGLAQMIHAASRGDAQALQAVAMMAQQMTQAPGDMARLGGQMKRLVDGERDLEVLCQGMSSNGERLMQNLVAELEQLAAH